MAGWLNTKVLRRSYPANPLWVFLFMETYNIEYAYLSNTPSFVHRTGDSEPFLEDNKEAILSTYETLVLDLKRQEVKNAADYLANKDAFEKKKCLLCGGKLRYIETWDFWGCVNYSSNTNNEKHTSFSGKQPNFHQGHVRISVNWLTDIIRSLGIDKHVLTKDLYAWLIVLNGKDDLLLKYSNTDSRKKIMGYNKTRLRSIKMELACFDYLQTLYDKVIHQQCITYKLEGKNESFCIPDFICSKGDYVAVIDAKLDRPNDDKMMLYVSLVQHILKASNSPRFVEGFHIMYEFSDWTADNSIFSILKLPKSHV